MTLLSWCAKAGVPLEDREILGRHCASVRSSAVVYSRDLQSSALASLEQIIAKVKAGEFDPNAPRSLRWKHIDPVVTVKSDDEPAEDRLHSPDAIISESHEDFTSEDACAESEPGTGTDPANAPPPHLQNIHSGIVHRTRSLDPDKFRCGSVVSRNFVIVSGDLSKMNLCGRCFRDVHMNSAALP